MLYAYQYGIITVERSEFHNNSAIDNGGVLYFRYKGTKIKIEASEFYNNNAKYGGVLIAFDSIITIKSSSFHYNSTIEEGGVLYSVASTITMDSSNFTKNRSPIGAVIFAHEGSKLQFQNYLLFDANSAEDYGVIYLTDSQLNGNPSSSFIFSNNLGSLVASNSNITINRCASFVNNTRM